MNTAFTAAGSIERAFPRVFDSAVLDSSDSFPSPVPKTPEKEKKSRFEGAMSWVLTLFLQYR